MTPPRYQHDCERCRYLGTFRAHDLYYCKQHPDGPSTVIARYGDDGPDYVSGVEFAPMDLILAHAIYLVEVNDEIEWIGVPRLMTDGSATWARAITELIDAWTHARKRAEIWKRVAKRIWTRAVPAWSVRMRGHER